MIRLLFLFIIFFSLASGFEIAYDKGVRRGEHFAVLHLMDDFAFSCKALNKNNIFFYKCIITGKTNFPLQNKSFKEFNLSFEQEKKRIIIYIHPKMFSKMYSFNVLFKDNIVYAQTQGHSRHYSFIFSKPLRYAKSYEGLNFNVIFDKLKTPSIGALNLNSTPLILPHSADVNAYLYIKKEYDKGDYSIVLRDASKDLKRYKGSIFSSEFFLYKLRAMNKIYTYSHDKNYKALGKMLKDTKLWMREHPNDANFPEVMYYTMRAYLSLGQKSNAKYVMNILKTEHFSSYFSQLARLDYVDYANSIAQEEKNLQPYVNLYYESKFKKIAARAATTLAIQYFLQKRDRLGLRFTKIILKSSSSYLQEDKRRALALSELLDKNGYYDLSAKTYELLFYSLNKTDKEYESVLKTLGLVLLRAKKYDLASKYFNYYLKEYPQGAYVQLVKQALDQIFLATSDANTPNLHARYEALIKKYAGPIAFKALEKNILLYYKQQNYPAIIANKHEIEKYSSKVLIPYLKNSAVKEIDISLKSGLCMHAIKTLKLFKQYKIDNEIQDKKAMLSCLMSTQNIDLARIYIKRNFNSDKVYYGIKAAAMALRDQKYKLAKKEALAVLKLHTIKSKQEIDQARHILFLALLYNNDYNDAMQLLSLIKAQPMDFAMLKLYNDFLTYATANKMLVSVLNFSPRAIDYQNYVGSNVFSPQLEFNYLDALKQTKQPAKALNVLKDLVKLKLDAKNMARAYYLYAGFYLMQANTQEAKLWLQKCTKLKASSWQDLCTGKLKLLK